MKILKNISTFIFLTLITLGQISAQLNESEKDSLLTMTDNKHKLLMLLMEADPIQNPKLEQAMELSKEALRLSINQKNKAAEAIANKNMGVIYQKLFADYEQALSYCFNALDIEKNQKIKEGQIVTLTLIGDIYQEVGNNYKALEHYMQAKILIEEVDNTISKVEIFNRIGSIYNNLSELNKALDYHQTALSLSQQINNKALEAISIAKIAQTYHNFGNTPEAILKTSKALSLYTEIADTLGMSKSFNLLGRLYTIKGDNKTAKQELKKAITLRLTQQNKEGLAESHNLLGALLLKEKDFKKSYIHLSKGLGFGLESNSKKRIRDSYENLYNYYSIKKNFKKALSYKDKFISISEFIYSEESNRKMAELQTEYEIEQKQHEIEAIQKEKEITDLENAKQRNRNRFLFILAGLFIVIAALILYLFLSKQKANKKLQEINSTISKQKNQLLELNATKDKFFSIISHDLKGPLNSLSSFVGLLQKHTDKMTTAEIQDLAKDLDGSLKNLFTLMENLLEWARSQSGNIELKPTVMEINPLIKDQISILQKQADAKRISITAELADDMYFHADKNAIETIIRNLVSNAIKFTELEGQILVSSRDLQASIEVSVTDNGVGMPSNIIDTIFRIDQKTSTKGTADERGTGIGLILCKEFTEKSGGVIEAASIEGEGSTFRFTIPKGSNE